MILIYGSGPLIRVEYGEFRTAAGFALVYRPGLGFVWVQYGDGSSGLSTWQTDGAGSAAFVANERDFVWLADGAGGCEWQSSFAEISGFRADGAGTAIWYAAGNPLLMDGHGSATFRAQTIGPPGTFRADGKGTCRFAGQQAVGEECLTPETDVPVSIPNFVF